MSKNLACFLVVLTTLAAGCGKEGVPAPPVPDIPRAVTDLVVSQSDDAIVLEWSYPSLTTSGKTLTSIQKIVVYRFDQELPASLAEQIGAAPGETPPGIAAFDRFPLPTPVQFARARIPAGELSVDDLPSYTSGTRILFEDRAPLRGASGLPMRYTYAVVTEGRRVESAPSNLVSIVPQPPVARPERLIARLSPELVQLAWDPVETFASGEGRPSLAGYRIYRSFLGESAARLNDAPVKETIYDDRPAYGTYTYFVTAVTAVQPDIESAASELVTVEFRDMLPPPPPATVTALVEDEAVRLIWDPVAVPDLAGYVVYRWDGATRVRVSESLVTEASWVDRNPPRGVALVYGVTSVDTTGNEGIQTVSQPVTVAR